MKRLLVAFAGVGLILAALLTTARSEQPVLAASANSQFNHAASAPASQSAALNGECSIAAANLLGAWVDAGAPNGEFPFESNDGAACVGTFEADILPLFTEADVWFEGSQACTDCHFDNSADSRHEMDLSSYAGVMAGADVASAPPGVPVVVPGDWEGSVLRGRMRNNRMPPGWEFDITEGNRNGPTLTVNGGEVSAVGLLEAWVSAGAPDGEFSFTSADGASHTGAFEADILPLFTEADVWFEGAQACTDCHFDNSADSRHEMDLSSYAGVMAGADVASAPPGVPVVVPGDWEASVLRGRMRNNRMPPGWEFDITEGNRNGPVIVAGHPTATTEPAATPTVTPTAEPFVPAHIGVEPTSAPSAPQPLPDPTRTEDVTPPAVPWLLNLMAGLGLTLGMVVTFVYFGRLRAQENATAKLAGITSLVLGVTTIILGAVALQATTTGALTSVLTIHEQVPLAVMVTPTPDASQIYATNTERVEMWQRWMPNVYLRLTNPIPATDAAAAAEGKQLFFDQKCDVCHGTDLKGSTNYVWSPNLMPVDLTDAQVTTLPYFTDAYMYWRISEGGDDHPFMSAMPEWGNKLSATQVWQLVTFIRAQGQAVALSPEDEAALAALEKGECFSCHRLNGRGSKTGPAWDDVGETAGARIAGMSAADYLHQSILDPQAFTVPGYEDKFDLMPTDFSEKLTAEELDSIVAYLLRQTGD